MLLLLKNTTTSNISPTIMASNKKIPTLSKKPMGTATGSLETNSVSVGVGLGEGEKLAVGVGAACEMVSVCMLLQPLFSPINLQGAALPSTTRVVYPIMAST